MTEPRLDLAYMLEAPAYTDGGLPPRRAVRSIVPAKTGLTVRVSHGTPDAGRP